jgi:hypothetical protein
MTFAAFKNTSLKRVAWCIGRKGLIVRISAEGVGTLDAHRILWLLESNLKRLEEHRDRLKGGKAEY